MKKRIMTCLLTGAIVFSALGIHVYAEETTDASSELSESIYSFEVKLDGELYQFPMTYADFTAMGWTYKNDETAEIQPNSYSSAETFKKGSLEIYTYIYNLGINTVPVSESMIGGISMDQWQFDDAPETTLELPGGIHYGTSTIDDITAAYGTATDTYDGDLYTKLTYEYDSYQDVELYVSKETGVLNEVDIRNLIADKESNAAAASEVSDEPTEEVMSYQTPEELGDDLQSFVVEYAGDLYKLPAPVSVFEKNGWTIKEEDSDSVVSGKSFGWVYMMKDNQEYHAIARNYNANATTIRNCFVTSVKGNVNGPNLPITVQKGITVGMSKADLTSALEGSDYECDGESSDYFEYYTIEGKDSSLNKVEILLKKDEGKVTGIEVSNEPKKLD